MTQSLKLERHVLIRGKITCLTGLRIGGTKDDIEIGGIDNPIIRHPVNRFPYIPGSSLKGKLRSTLEYALGKVGRNGELCNCATPGCMVCTLFGPHRKPVHGLGPTRLLIRDAEMANAGDNPDRWVEVKSETAIDRQTGAAARGSLRQNERVAAGARFAFEMSLRVFEGDDETKMLQTVRQGLRLIENEYLGASGSRGYGKVKFTFEMPEAWREME